MEEKTKKILLILAVIFAILIGFLMYARFVATSGFIVKEYKITNEKINDNFHGTKVVHISDLHYGTTVNRNKLKSVVNKINYIEPDIVVFTGDLIDRNAEIESNEVNTIVKELRRIKPNLGNYAVLGTHDVENEAIKQILYQSNFILLNDDIEMIYKNDNHPILITGLSSLKSENDINVKLERTNEIVEDIEDDHYHILIAHEPDIVKQLDMEMFDIVMAGHSMNGQVRLPILGATILPEGAKTYYENKYIVDDTELFISSGLGTTRMNFRLFNRPSINFYRLTNK